MMSLNKKFDQEIFLAEEARLQEKEGQSRVHARRAAGIIVREYFRVLGLRFSASSSYELLLGLIQIPGLDERIRGAAENLTMRVTDDFTLPAGVDLIAEAQVLARALISGLQES